MGVLRNISSGTVEHTIKILVCVWVLLLGLYLAIDHRRNLIKVPSSSSELVQEVSVRSGRIGISKSMRMAFIG